LSHTHIVRSCHRKIEAYLFVKHGCGNRIIIVPLYVDDLIFTGSDQIMFDEFKHSMKKKFAMTDLERMRYFLGVEVKQDNNEIFIDQQ